MSSSSTHLSFLAGRTSPPPFSSERVGLPPQRVEFRIPKSRFSCSAGQSGFFSRLGRLIKEKAKSDVEKVFSGFSKTRENLAVIDELLLFWNLAETDRVLDELEEALLVSDFGPKITVRIVERLRDDIMSGKLKSGTEIKDALKGSVLEMLAKKNSKTELQLGFRKPAVVMIVGVNGGGKTTSLGKLAHRLKNEGTKVLMAAGDTFRAAASDQLEIWAERTGCDIVVAEGEKAKAATGKLKSGTEIKDALKGSVLEMLAKKNSKTELQLGFRKPAVVMIVGVNGGGKTTSLGKLAHRLKNEGTKVLMAAGDTFRAAASDQLEIWAERTGCDIVVAEGEKAKAATVLTKAVKRGKEEGYDIVLCDTSGRLHTNFSLMEELIACKKAVGKVVSGAPNEILLVLDGNTGLNMLPQAREFNEIVGITGLILTKLDGSARGGCVVSVVEELGIPVKFIGVGEAVEDLQPFDADAFVNAIFS
ncbi:hypothetical protein DY000_02036051 [Brassica cretica]|uniref:SRP54-type proteins GTP-binding domain-containing protein n=1 Tax=Brassica cretica TaxID=69181 RepID=A0ABQ7DLJ8_BRACR|nr:hypothetical protein DY000_02036051 [Brassica cretica]